jgi:hypothetical protein
MIRVETEVQKKEAKIKDLETEIENKDIESKSRYDALMRAKEEMERSNNQKI